MWSNLLDEKGRVRASIFYKSAFYDRSAFIRTNRRYSINPFATKDRESRIQKAHVMDQSSTIHDLETTGKDGEEYFEVIDRLENECKKWLNENYPLWENDDAYWD